MKKLLLKQTNVRISDFDPCSLIRTGPGNARTIVATCATPLASAELYHSVEWVDALADALENVQRMLANGNVCRNEIVHYPDVLLANLRREREAIYGKYPPDGRITV